MSAVAESPIERLIRRGNLPLFKSDQIAGDAPARKRPNQYRRAR